MLIRTCDRGELRFSSAVSQAVPNLNSEFIGIWAPFGTGQVYLNSDTCLIPVPSFPRMAHGNDFSPGVTC
jgi:hypothetical protein